MGVFQLFKCDGTLPAKTVGKCPPENLIPFVSSHFNPTQSTTTPTELSNPPKFTTELQQISARLDILQGPPDELELVAALKKIKNNRASNDIAGELLKYGSGSKSLLREIMKVTNEIWA